MKLKLPRLWVERDGEEQHLGLLLVPEVGDGSPLDPLLGGESVLSISLGIEGELLDDLLFQGDLFGHGVDEVSR